MEGGASNKDLARARFKQQQHGRRVHGRGGGRRGTFGRKREPGNSGSEEDDDEEDAPAHGRSLDLPPAYDDSDAEEPSAGPRLRSNGADLAALLAECDASALPRQHVSAYLDPSWSVDDLGELQRALGGGGSGLGADELSVDAHGLIRQLRELPLAELLGLSREYAEALGEGPEYDEARDDGPGPGPGGDETGPRGTGPPGRRVSTPAPSPAAPNPPAPKDPPAHTNPPAPKDGDDDLDALLASTRAGPSDPHLPGASVVGDDELDDLLGISTGAAGNRGIGGAGRGSSATAAARTDDDDDAFLDELLG